MIKTIKTRFFPNLGFNLGLRCVHILNYGYAWSKPCARILNDAYASFSIETVKSHFYDLIKKKTKETYKKP